jgi:hypothetical protein
MARRRRQALTGASYELREDGQLKVTTRTGEGGIGKANGAWVEGNYPTPLRTGAPSSPDHRCPRATTLR